MRDGVLRIHNLQRQAVAFGISLERLIAERPTMPASVAKLRLKHLRRRAEKLGCSIERCFAWDSAISLAFQERTGLELQPGEAFTEADANRAAEIMKLYPKA